jgi:Rrf2 family transcriptional regulator, nitric oxide-sensitive transcriptional repressor
MNKLNRKIEYSLIALKHMSSKRPGELTTAKEVADHFRAPFDATARVLQIMAQQGLLRAEHGVLGGYQITRDLSRVSLHELIEMIQGPTKIARCMHAPCELHSHCNILSPIQKLNHRLEDFYRSVTLADLVFNWSAEAVSL